MHKLIYSLLFFAFILGSTYTFSQNETGLTQIITLKIISEKKEPVSFSTIHITNRNDSNDVKKLVADSNGVATVQLKKNNQYTVNITVINYLPLEKGIHITGNQTLFNFILESAGKTLEAVVVTSKKPLMRQEDDKLIIDPENLIEASTSGFEVIEKTPGLFVDQDGNIYISSLSPAAVQINGRDMRMSAADVATLLKSLPPNSISKIEILRTPSAKYDASGSGGIVNVVLKKGVKIGTTGSVNGGLQQGRYGNQFIGFNINNNDGKKSSFINLNYSKRNNYEKLITNRLFAADTILKQDAITKYPSDVYFAGYGIAFPVGKKWELDFGTSGSFNDYKNRGNNINSIEKVSTAQTIATNLNTTSNDGSSLNYRIGLEGKLKIDSTGSEWENDISYNYTANKAQQLFGLYNNNSFLQISGGDGSSDNHRNLFTFRSDLKQKMKHKFTFETGIKTSLLQYNSVTEFYKEFPIGNRSKDFGRTNTFKYKENINAAYLQGSKTIGKDLVIKIGTRLENTNMEGRQIIPSDTTFSLYRTDLFPYIYISKNLMKIASYDLRAYIIYRKTISRPVYEQLNPFAKYIDQYLSEIGNPSLKPQFTENYEANVSVDERPILAVGVNDTKDIFSIVTYQADSSQSQAYRTYDNIGKNKEWYFRGLGAIPPGGRYFFVIGAQYNHNFYQGLYENQPLSFKKGTWTFFTYQTFKIDKRSVITLNGFLRLKGQQQLYEIETFGTLNTSVNRKFLKDKLTVALNMSDLFMTNKNSFAIKQGSLNATGVRQSDTRRFGINVRYNFGLRKKEDNNNIFNVESPDKTN